MSKEEEQGLTFFLFLCAGGIVVHSFSFSFFSLPFAFSSHAFLRWFFLVIPVQIRFQSNGSDIGLARPPIEPLTGTERVDVFLSFLCSDLFFSPTEKALVWCVLLLWCLPERIPSAVIYTPQVCRSCETIFGMLFLCFFGIETFRGNLWRVKFLLFQHRTTLVFSTLFRLCGRTTLTTPF